MQNILLAAGLAERSGGEKLFLPWKGETVLVHAVRSSLEAGLYTVVVTGFRHDEALRLLAPLVCGNLLVIRNGEYRSGQGSSAKTGAAALHPGSPFFISLADMPLIEARHYRFLSDAGLTADALRPVRGREIGHPVLLASRLRTEIERMEPASSVRALLAGHTMQACTVDDDAYFADIDTIQAYEALLAGNGPNAARRP